MAAPELRLDVRLNLATFRTDLGRAAQTAASYYYPINLLINKQNLTKQLTAIGRSLGTTKYNIDLNDTSVDLAAGKIDKLAASLKKLSGSIQIDFNAGGGTKSIGTAMKEMAAKLAKESKGDINRAVEQMTGMRGTAPFGAGTRSIPGFKAAAKGMGIENAFKLFFQELQQVDPQSLKKALDDGSVMMMQENREIKQKFDKIQSSAEGLARDLRAMGEAARATGKASFTAGGKTLYPQNYGLKIASLLSQVEKLDKDLRSVSGQSGGELLNNLTELSSVLRTTSNSFVGIAGLSANLDQTLRGFDIATKAAASATIAYTERIRRRGGIEYGPSTQRLLPPSPTLSLREMGEAMAQRYQAPSRGIKGLLPAGGKTPGEAITEAYIEELRRSFSSRNAIAGLLPPAVEPSPGAYRIARPAPAPPVVETRAELFARRTRQAYINSAARAADERQSPLALPPARERGLGQPPLYQAPSLPPTGESAYLGGRTGSSVRTRTPGGFIGGMGGPSGGGAEANAFVDASRNALKYSELLKVADASTRNFNASQIPLIGGIKNLAGEFGQAAKQVLLYGTAYKGLAFLTSLPGQILNAAKSQQQFANGLKVATQDTGTFGKELLYVDNVQRAFGLNLETTRAGFTRLYASMAPTGFDSGSIEKLFTGISAATASLQLTPDKAERVIYAFGQMASKGQIMSEELKGQLGDVLPGALAIFSKAAGMSVKEFSKAMEDGEFVGNRFKEVFAKVSDELMNRFGTGAQAAGRSLQGLINTVGGDFQRVLESFSPLANSAAQAILGPLGGSLKQLALSAQIATGEIERVFMQLKASQQDLQDLRTSAGTDGIITADEARQIKAAEQNVAALTAKYKSLQQAASDPAIARQAQDITKFTEELGKAGTFVMNVAKTIGSILSPALNFLGTNLTTVISLITSFYIGFQTARLAALALMGVLLLYRTLSAILGFGPAALSANALATAFSGLGIAATGAQVKVIGLRLALTALVASTVIGAVVGGIMLIAGAFASMRDRAKEASQASRDAAKAAIDAAQTGGVAQAAMSVQTILGESRKAAAARKALEGIMARSTKAQRAGIEPMSLTMEESVALKGSSLTEKMVRPAIGGKPQMQVPSKGDADAIIREFGSLAGQQDLNLRESKSALATAQRVARETGQNIPDPTATTADTQTEEDKKKTSLESYASLQDQLAKDFTQAQIDRLEQEYQAKVNRINDEFDLREARANSFQKEAIKFERQMADIELKKQKALLDASNEVLKARGSVAGGAGGMTTGATGLLQGSTGISSGAHFDIRRTDGSYISPDQALALLDPAVRRQLTMTSAYGPRDTGIPGASTFHKGVDLAGPANTPLNLAPGYSMVGQGEEGGLGYAATVQGPQGEMYKVGHLQRPGVGAGVGAGAPRKVPGSEKRDIVADQKAQLAVAQESLAVQIAEAQAVRDAAIAWAEYTTAITPIEEQKLQNSLLAKKNELVKSGLPDDVIEKEMKQFETQQKTAMAVDVVNKMLNNKKISAEQAASMIAELNKNMADYNKLLGDNLVLQNQQKFDANMGALRKQLDIAGIVDPRKELRARIAQERTGYSPEQVEQEALLQEQVNAAQKARDQLRSIASTIGDSFGEAFKGIITGTSSVREALAGMFQSIADSFADMVAQMIAEWLKAQLIKGFQSLFSAVLPGLGAAAGGLSSGFSAGTSSAIDTGAAGWASSFATPLKFANGGIATGGFTAFANGGIVTGPTLGLVGEGRYNEAVIPLPDGKSVPVDLGGMAGGMGGEVTSNIVVNINNGQMQGNGNSNGSELGRKIEGAVKQVLVSELRPGGILSGGKR